MEKILSISEQTFRHGEYSDYEGVVIKTDAQEIKMGIQYGQSCCESWGSLISNDTYEEFIGAEILDISITDTALNTKSIKDCEILESSETSCMFININTSAGLLQFTAYNCHNGYYGHEAVLISQQLNHSENL